MSMPQQDTRVRPSAWWYALTVALWIASFVVFIIAIKPVISIFSAGVDQVQNNRQIAVSSDGFTVYASASSTSATCTLTDGGRSIRLTPFNRADADNFSFSFDNGPDVHPLATTPKDMAPGAYTLSCKGVPRTAVLATGKRLDFNDFAGRLAVGVIASILCGLGGLIWLIVMLVRRHNSKQRLRQAQAAASYGYGYGGYPPGPSYPGYPGGGSPQGGYPPSGSPSYPPPAERSPDASGSGYGSPPPPPAANPEPPAGSSGPPPPDDQERRE